MLKKIDKLWAFSIIFMNGWLFALPVTEEPIPVWLSPIQVVHGIYIYEALIIIYVAYIIITRWDKLPNPFSLAGAYGNMIFILGVLGVLSACVNMRFFEILGSSRYFILYLYFTLSIYWAKKYNPTFIIRTFILGIALSGASNIYLAFMLRSNELGGLPFLLGQNGPGGSLGIMVILSAWLMLESENYFDVVIALASCLIGVIGSSISYSKTAMLLSGLGLTSWVFVLRYQIFKHKLVILTLLVVLFSFLYVKRDLLFEYIEGVETFATYKFQGAFREGDNSAEARFQYLIITMEIMFTNPFGVSYGGFYDAAIQTDGYNSSNSTPEDSQAGKNRESNPHSSFLYYASANGILGLFLSIILFITGIKIFWEYLSIHRGTGLVLWIVLSLGYFIYGLTLPTLYNTSTFYMPIAFAIALKQVYCKKSTRLSPNKVF